jgi:hypothetical protein
MQRSPCTATPKRLRRSADSPACRSIAATPKRLRRSADSPVSKRRNHTEAPAPKRRLPCIEASGSTLQRRRLALRHLAEAKQLEVHRDSRPPTTRRNALPSVDRPNDQRVTRCRNILVSTDRYDLHQDPNRSSTPSVGRCPSLVHDAEAPCPRTELQSDIPSQAECRNSLPSTTTPPWRCPAPNRPESLPDTWRFTLPTAPRDIAETMTLSTADKLWSPGSVLTFRVLLPVRIRSPEAGCYADPRRVALLGLMPSRVLSLVTLAPLLHRASPHELLPPLHPKMLWGMSLQGFCVTRWACLASETADPPGLCHLLTLTNV